MADICPKADPSSGQAEGESFYRQSGGEGYMQKHYSHLQLVISGITGIILVILGTVNVQFQVCLFVCLCGLFLELWQLKSWVQSGHPVVNFSTWGFSIYRTGYGSEFIVFEKELKVLDYA